MEVKVKLSNEEVATILYNCFCNGGLQMLNMSGIGLDYKDKDYKECGAKLKNPCSEDVYKQMLLDGKPMQFIDNEDDGVTVADITIEKAKMNFEKHCDKIFDDLQASLGEDGDDDGEVCDRLLQYAAFGEIVYG